MKTEIIVIGNELISGKTRDLNGWYASGRLLSNGIEVSEIRTVGDNYKSLSSVLKAATERSNFIIVTGGLGPTEDDLTTETASKVFERPLILYNDILDNIREFTRKSGLNSSPSLEKLAWLPEGAKILDQKKEMCGFSLTEGKSLLYFLPGVPEQMRELLDKSVIPDIFRVFTPKNLLQHRLIKVYGLREADIADALKGLSEECPGIMFGFYPSFPENHINITARGNKDIETENMLNSAERKIKDILGSYIFASNDKSMEAVVGELLKGRKQTLSIAESCTGGLIGHRLTSVPGSSLYFERGVIVYSNRSKIEMLGVRQNTIDTYGAVSYQTAREMAEGVRSISKTDMGLSVTGIAGPSGGERNKPVGTVFIGLSVGDEILSSQYLFSGTRERVKTNTSEMALDWIRRYVYGYPFIPGI
ncbi:MAG: competence/damage-inducible protein A [Thermodesulfobacteriota bacterium]|nr:competence/damage-inducible protein A [Thermodesulfobacteriota bacterium]